MENHPFVYQRRTPEQSVLYQVILQHWQTFKAQAEAEGRVFPPFVEREFEKYSDCGILSRGFVRVRCAECGYDRLVAFSCKGRGFCGSCIGRRMADTAAFLVDRVLPDIPMRSWTLTFPQPLRYRLAYDAALLGMATRCFMKALFGWLRFAAQKELGLANSKGLMPGAIVWTQRFGSAANLHVHLHAIVTEGVYVEANGHAQWHTVRAPNSGEVAQIAWNTCQRVMKVLKKRGLSLAGESGDIDELGERDPLLAACYAASIRGLVATGSRAGQPLVRLGFVSNDHQEDAGTVNGPAHGFNLHAGRCISATDRARREQIIRYSTRPPLPENRLTLNEDGTVLLKLKSPWPNGTTHIKLTGPELIERLVALVPPPRVNQIKFYGVFAPNAALRPKIVPARLEDETEGHKHGEKNNGQYLDWQELMKRVFDLDILVCPRCNSKMQRIAVITEGSVIRRILKSVGLPTAPPKFSPARYPDQTEFWFEETA